LRTETKQKTKSEARTWELLRIRLNGKEKRGGEVGRGIFLERQGEKHMRGMASIWRGRPPNHETRLPSTFKKNDRYN